MPDQYNNDANWRAHYDGTGVEIWEQTRGTVTHFVAGARDQRHLRRGHRGVSRR